MGHGRDVTRYAGDVACNPSLCASAIKENRRENTNLFPKSVHGAVMLIGPATSHMGDRSI